MQKLKILMALILCFGVLSGLWCCRTPAGRTAGQVLDDSAISTIVKAKLFEDPYLSGFAVSVKTFEGEVTLTGAVDSQFAKDRATAVAQSVDGVKRVNNLVVLR